MAPPDDPHLRAQFSKPERFGRGGPVKNRLLDDSDNNIGNSTTCNPQLNPTPNVETNPPRIIALDALSPTGQMVTIVINNRFLGKANSPIPFNNFPYGGSIGGPLVGIIEFGNGSVFTKVEVDVPMGPVIFNGSEPQDGGTVISLPAGTIRVYGRNDGNLIPLTASGRIAGVASGAPPSGPISVSPSSVSVKAHADYFTRSAVKSPTRTLYLYLGSGGVVPFASGVEVFSIPPFAKAVRVIRFGALPTSLPPFVITFVDPATGFTIDPVTVPVGVPSPLITVPSIATWFAVDGGPFGFLAAEFQIGI